MFDRSHRFLFFGLILLVAPLLQGQGDAPPPRHWTNSLGLGVALTSGNRDTTSVNVSVSTSYDPKSRRTFKANALYLRGDADGEVQVDKATAGARYEETHDSGFWFTEISFLRDPLKGMESLVSPVAGFGYNVIKTDERTLSFDAGAGGAFERTRDLGSEASFAIKGGETFEWAISPTSKVTQRLTGLWKAGDLGDAHYHFDAGLTTTIAARAELKLSYVFDYKNEPPEEFEKGDSALFAALVYKF